jgi:hypothetical protein
LRLISTMAPLCTREMVTAKMLRTSATVIAAVKAFPHLAPPGPVLDDCARLDAKVCKQL